MPYFGDIFIPWITDKDTSITKETIEKNFVDEKPQVYELTPDLEGGTYNLVLNENYSDKNETLNEQQDAVLSMVSRHGTEFPFSIGNDQAYLLVSGADTSIDPRQEIREATIQARILPRSKYASAVEVKPHPVNGAGDFNYDLGNYTYIGFPSNVGVSSTKDFTISSEDGDIDIYSLSSNSLFEIYERAEGYGLNYGADYGRGTSVLMSSEQQSICKLFGASGQRIYSDYTVAEQGSVLNNSLIKTTLNASSSNIDVWDGSAWSNLGSLELAYENGYALNNENRKVELEFVNGNKETIYHSLPAVRYNISNTGDFVFTPNLTNISQVESNNYYSVWTDPNDSTGEDIIMVRLVDNGNFFTDTTAGTFGIENMDPTEGNDVFIGKVLDDLTIEEMVQSIYTHGTRRNTFVQK
jgi:hypothetical protein